jgi:hypothetical protein
MLNKIFTLIVGFSLVFISFGHVGKTEPLGSSHGNNVRRYFHPAQPLYIGIVYLTQFHDWEYQKLSVSFVRNKICTERYTPNDFYYVEDNKKVLASENLFRVPGALKGYFLFRWDTIYRSEKPN